MKFFLVLIAIASGVGTSLQAGSNATLQKAAQSPLWTMTLVSATTVTVCLLTAGVLGGPFPSLDQLGRTPWWAWIGGLFGALILFATVYVSPALGAGAFVATIVTASTLTSLVLDNYGLMGFDVHQAGVGRIIGGVLMVLGVACIAAF